MKYIIWIVLIVVSVVISAVCFNLGKYGWCVLYIIIAAFICWLMADYFLTEDSKRKL
jgi:hypothetical protein